MVGLSPTLGALVLEVAFEAKKVLFTETDLKVAGRFVEEVRECPFPSGFEGSCREASVSEPLMLTSAEITASSWSSLTVLSTAEVELDSPLVSGPRGASADGFSETETSGLPSSD